MGQVDRFWRAVGAEAVRRGLGGENSVSRRSERGQCKAVRQVRARQSAMPDPLVERPRRQRGCRPQACCSYDVYCLKIITRCFDCSGLGVYWLHVRFDSRPKYYNYQKYKILPYD